MVQAGILRESNALDLLKPRLGNWWTVTPRQSIDRCSHKASSKFRFKGWKILYLLMGKAECPIVRGEDTER